MENLVEIAHKAIEDYGYRQVVVWSPDDIIAQWGLSDREARVLLDTVRGALEALPVPVQPDDVPAELERIKGLISTALRS
jgi:hypothetical protein